MIRMSKEEFIEALKNMEGKTIMFSTSGPTMDCLKGLREEGDEFIEAIDECLGRKGYTLEDFLSGEILKHVKEPIRKPIKEDDSTKLAKENELTENILMLARKLENKNNELFHMKDYLEALYDGRIDYTEEKVATAKMGYRIARAERNEVIRDLKELFG